MHDSSFFRQLEHVEKKAVLLPDEAGVSVKITNPDVFVQVFIVVWFSSFKLNTITLENVETPLKTSKR